MPTKPAPSRQHIALWAMIGLATIALSLWDYNSFQVGTYWDDVNYIILARSLLSGSYRMIHTPQVTEGVLYPIGYPLLLAPLAALFPGNLDALKALSLLATLSSGAILFWGWPWFSQRSRYWGLAVIALYSFSPVTVEHTRMVMSEAVFTAFTLLAILLAEQLVHAPRPRWTRFGLLAGLLIFVPLIRTVGILLLPCVVLYLWVKGNRRLRQSLLMVSLVLGLLGASMLLIPTQAFFPSRYLREHNAALLLALYSGVAPTRAADILPQWYIIETPTGERRVDVAGLLHELWRYRLPQHLFQDLRALIFPLGGGEREQALGARLGLPGLSVAVGFSIFLLIVLGYLQGFRQEGVTLFSGFGGIYFAALLLWNWLGPRMLYPIQPQLQLAFLVGIESLVLTGARLARRHQVGGKIITGVVVLLATLGAYRSLQLKDSRTHIGDLQARTHWAAAHLPTDARLLTEEPERDFIYSGRLTWPQPLLDLTLSAPPLQSRTAEPGIFTAPPAPTGNLPSAATLYAYLKYHHIDYILIAPQIIWQPQYTPSFSDNTQRLWILVSQLHNIGLADPLYTSETERLYIFKIK